MLSGPPIAKPAPRFANYRGRGAFEFLLRCGTHLVASPPGGAAATKLKGHLPSAMAGAMASWSTAAVASEKARAYHSGIRLKMSRRVDVACFCGKRKKGNGFLSYHCRIPTAISSV